MSDPILIVVFLRGGMDGLNLVSPTGDTDYVAARPEDLRVLRKGDNPGIPLADQAADVDFRFHPAAAPFAEMFGARELAVIHAAGLTDGTRSHFDAEARMERAAKGGAAGGWLGRWYDANRPDGPLPILAAGSSLPDSLAGTRDVAVADALEDLILAQGHDLSPTLRRRIREGFGAHPLIGAPISALLHLSEVLEARITDADTGEVADYKPSVDYPDNELAQPLKTIARAIKLDLGLRIATLDYGGWDTHVNQRGEFAQNLERLSVGLTAFWRDLGPAQDRTNVVIMSEFGRRLRSNTAGGTDHGFGNAMMVLGAGIRGGRMYGRWPGLANDALNAGADLDITTDYRHVLADVLRHHMGQGDLSSILPGFTPEPLGLYRPA
ncbi:MAG: DUF1501 domain-containing protein [Paracoccaceae bacterium]